MSPSAERIRKIPLGLVAWFPRMEVQKDVQPLKLLSSKPFSWYLAVLNLVMGLVQHLTGLGSDEHRFCHGAVSYQQGKWWIGHVHAWWCPLTRMLIIANQFVSNSWIHIERLCLKDIKNTISPIQTIQPSSGIKPPRDLAGNTTQYLPYPTGICSPMWQNVVINGYRIWEELGGLTAPTPNNTRINS